MSECARTLGRDTIERPEVGTISHLGSLLRRHENWVGFPRLAIAGVIVRP
jgi:hypothetical protein